jgi:hypothetical protein
VGQLITVAQKPTTRAGVVVFELNRSLTGMGHERYRAGQPVTGHRPVDELARRLLAAGGVEAVSVYSNVVTLQVTGTADIPRLGETIRHLFIYYREGVTPPAVAG